ncbi:acyl CoA binding protein [Naegleria gruberi]|uniref:Acyl CoA binding protein n=1 Tax=Naegleria gruberi TaxID=5762 RepID=D2VD50_NAEGR|nr:acyl CoA binding protein [Naegleria gruberi]EFC45268.1 acyl CoA binding protein [Naegleria gruberi]|eukprot:XP_002678012.1 acyl CoA binding protein [Naegleria gruberi strain NEG-M]
MGLQEDFTQAAEDIKKLTSGPTNDDLLLLYSLYKQATVGDCNTDQPSIFYMKDRAKWDAWKGKEGMTKEDAMEQYVALVKELLAKHQ